ncbi:type I restriction-modification system subunit M N-terminal domain-containing protein [Nocardioides sp. LHG3406-4]|uniref:type I restriction-modification system subunit M N-terminal domain-containing protein n=1 Tax=Nocardioides sp. LHG3406-4 TaxID=2804575 RepID=UPI003CED06A3
MIEQITYLLFIRRLDDLQTLAEKKANRTGQPIESSLFQPGQADPRWSKISRKRCSRSRGDEVVESIPVPVRVSTSVSQ